MKKKLFFFIFGFSVSPLFSQTFEAELQLRPRFEYRNGYKTLLLENQDPAIFVSQRSRIVLGYRDEKLAVKLSPQNVSVWGDVSINRLEESTGITFLEAYGQYQASADFMFRLGRQVLAYDNQRILGEVNWAQQGQSHDAALISWLPKTNQRIDVAVAYNAQAQDLVETPYLVNSYKNLQLAWYHLELGKVELSLLAMNTGYEPEGREEREIDYIQTFGAFHKFSLGSFFGDAAAYMQSGQRNDRNIKAWYAGINLHYSFNSTFRTGAGAEYLSGTDMDEASTTIHSFTPLFGTNHGFNGFMDYFFAGNHQNSVGLLDIYGKLSYLSPKWEFSVIPHAFTAAAEVVNNGKVMDDYLGTEVDFTGVYKRTRDFSVGFGYSQIFGTTTLEVLKGGNLEITQNWAWLMVTFNPKLLTFTGKD